MPQRDPDGGKRSQRQQQRIQPPAEGPGVMGGSDQEQQAESKYAHSLKNAQRTGVQMQHDLCVVGIRQQADAGQKSEEITPACRHQRRVSACAASICFATSSREEWRISLPCTM